MQEKNINLGQLVNKIVKKITNSCHIHVNFIYTQAN